MTFLGRYLELQKQSKDPKKDGLDDIVITYNVVGTAVGTSALVSPVSLIFEYFLRPENKHLLDAIRAENDNNVIKKYVLEATRFNPPAPFFTRQALSDFTINEGKPTAQKVSNGQIVLVGVAAAMMDPAGFPNPQEFRLDRPDDNYLTFGHSFHKCFGLPQVLALVPSILKVLASKDDLHLMPNVKLGYLGPDFTISPYPQSLLLRYQSEKA